MRMFKKSNIEILLLAGCLLCGCQNGNDMSAAAPPATEIFDFTILKAGQADAIILPLQK